MSESTALPYEVRDPSALAPLLREWTKIPGVYNPQAAAAGFIVLRGYEARDWPRGLTLEVRHPTSAPQVYEVRVTVPRPRFKVHMHTKKRADDRRSSEGPKR